MGTAGSMHPPGHSPDRCSPWVIGEKRQRDRVWEASQAGPASRMSSTGGTPKAAGVREGQAGCPGEGMQPSAESTATAAARRRDPRGPIP